jgi:hypothetical protein
MRNLLAILGLVLGLAGLPADAAETYKLLFREGTLDGFSAGQKLSYIARRTGRSAPEAEQVPGQEITPPPAELRLDLTLAPENEVVLTAVQGETQQPAGRFPGSVGNPLIMYFLETVLRDMSNQAGGSPFYIRNRIKESFTREADIRPLALSLDGRAVAAQEITLHPFANDAARARMSGFADLTLVAVVSDEVPGWYYSLSAAAPPAPGEAGPGYSNAITLMPEAAK